MLVTAFGPFAGRSVNASSLALVRLRQMHRGLATRILPVDLVEAPRRLGDAVRRVRPRALVLLGEAGSAERIRLESRAWNEMDFTIPDLAGRQPRGRRIDLAAADFVETTVDIPALLDRLTAANIDAGASTDPGRYLCNRLYHAALSRFSIPSLFIHLPLESILPTEEAARAISIVLREIG
jgi:pyroglutamyl-peptidase